MLKIFNHLFAQLPPNFNLQFDWELINLFGHFNSLLLKYYLVNNKMIIYKYTFYLELICSKFKILAKYQFCTKLSLKLECILI